MDEACACLQQAADDLKRLVGERFEAAVAKSDEGEVFRFARLFPLLGEHASGLTRLGEYLRHRLNQLNASSAQTSVASAKPVVQLTQLFENVATLLKQVLPLLQSDFGYGHLIECVQVLQFECDQRSDRILSDFEKSRDVTGLCGNARRQLKQSLQELAVNALTESNLAAGLTSSSSVSTVSFGSSFAAAGSIAGTSASSSPGSNFEPLELDALLDELSQIRTRTNRYLRFISTLLIDDFHQARLLNPATVTERTADQVKQVLQDCPLIRRLQQFNDRHVLLEACYLRGCILKALRLDRPVTQSRTSSALEDAFFVANISTQRAWDGQSVDVLCACINHTAMALDHGFWHALHERLAAGYPAANSMLATALDLRQSYGVWAQSGRIRSGGSTDLERSRRSFQMAINNLSVAGTYCGKLRRSLASLVRTELLDDLLTSVLNEIEITSPLDLAVTSDLAGQNPNTARSTLFKPTQLEKLDSCLQQLDTLADKCERAASTGLQHLMTAVLSGKLRSWSDALSSESHILDEAQLVRYEAQDGLRSCTASFLVALDGIFGTLQQGLTEENFALLLDQFTGDLTRKVESAIKRCTFNKVTDRRLIIISFFFSKCIY